MARNHPPICNHGSAEIHELPRLHGQQTTQDMAREDEDTISESRINTHPGTPIILLSTTTSSTPYVVWTPSLLPAPDLAKQLRRFQVVQRGIRRPPTPYPASTTNNNSITPSTFLSISAFILPREPTPKICIENAKYLSILNWDQPVPGSQYEQIPFNESSASEPYSQEPTPEPVARPSQPPWQQIVISEGIKIRRRPGDQWPSEASTSTIATELLPIEAHINGVHGVRTN
ncbi:hypothetical protein EDD85DRAFT_957470 [Armillaria nabsnona]|nr:hypothetical protein EDD85DRAFT_957470 [Armillaria nabsnona]